MYHGTEGDNVKYHDVINETQRQQLENEYRKFINGDVDYEISKDGCVIIPLFDMGSGSHIDNIVFVNPDNNIDRVYKLNISVGDDADFATDVILNREKRGYVYDKTRVAFENLFGEESLRRFSSGFLRENKEFVRGAKGEKIWTNGRNNEQVQNRVRNEKGSNERRSDVRNSIEVLRDKAKRYDIDYDLLDVLDNPTYDMITNDTMSQILDSVNILSHIPRTNFLTVAPVSKVDRISYSFVRSCLNSIGLSTVNFNQFNGGRASGTAYNERL